MKPRRSSGTTRPQGWLIVLGIVLALCISGTNLWMATGAFWTGDPLAPNLPRAIAPLPPVPTHWDSAPLKALAQMRIITDPNLQGYSRDQFGQAWRDLEHNGCDQKNDVLRRDTVKRHTKPGTRGCILAKGVIEEGHTSGYGKNGVIFERGNGLVEIDHTVSLHDAWRTGAWDWDATKREQFANDFMNLEAVDRATNRTKSDKSIAQWAPTNEVARCYFAARQVAIKKHYKLGVLEGERQAFLQILGSEYCGQDMRLPTARQFKAPKPRPIGETQGGMRHE